MCLQQHITKMSFAADKKKLPPHDQITELQRKIQLLEGDRTAFYESSQSTIKKNRESILQLRQENKRLYKKLAEVKAGDEHIIREAFRNKGLKRDAFHNMSGKAALTAVDQKVLSKTKHLNALKHTTQTYQQRLDELRMEYERIKHEARGGAVSSGARAHKKEEDLMKMHALENRLEKTQFMCKEAENITSHYQKLRRQLQDESLTFQVQLDGLEAEILKYREELHNLQVMNNDAQLSKEAAKTEFQQQEELLSRERKERERIITSYRKMVEECKAEAEKTERKVQRTIMHPDELSSEAQCSSTRITTEEEAMSTLEEAFRRIKEATGVTEAQKIVERFTTQKEMHQHLEKLRRENEEALQQLKEQRELLTQQFEEEKYSGDAKLSSEQQMLEECEHQLQAHQQRSDAAKEHLVWLTKTLSTVRAGVVHLVEKLQHIALGEEDGVTKEHPDSDEFVLKLLTQFELKLQLLQKEFEGKDLTAVMKEMGEDEFYNRIEENLPKYNTRVKLPEAQTVDLFDDAANKSDEDEADIISREVLKRQSQLIVDSNLKKKPWKRKKGKF